MGACQNPECPDRELVFFFSNLTWAVWDFGLDRMVRGPASLALYGILPLPFNEGFDACCQAPACDTADTHDQLLLFCGDKVLRWSHTQRIIISVKVIDDEFPQLPAPFCFGVTAAVGVPGAPKRLMFFSEGQWISYDASARIVVESSSNSRRFARLPEPFSSVVDAVVCRPQRQDRELIFFSNDMWMVWDYAPSEKRNNTHGPYNVTEMWFAQLSIAMRGAIQS